MNGRQTELEFIQITSGASSAGGHTLYGLTKDGRVFMFERGLGRWKAMPMIAHSEPALARIPA